MLIRCGECGAQVSDQSFTCPRCGRDVRVLKSNGAHCQNCEGRFGDCDGGPSGYHVCLHYVEDNDND